MSVYISAPADSTRDFRPYPIIVSFSGGRTSAYLLRLLLDNYPEADIRVVFANTSKEREETLAFVQECSIRWGIHITWIQAVINPELGQGNSYEVVSYETAARQGEVFEAAIKKYGIPNRSFPMCSRELKSNPIEKWVKDTVGDQYYEHALGIRADGADRAGDKKWYPLVQWGVTKRRVRAWWSAQPFDLQLKDYEGNCDLCWKKSLRKTYAVIEQRPGVADWWHEMEIKYSPISPERSRKTVHYFHHSNRSTAQLVEFVQRGKFQRVLDEEEQGRQVPMLDFELTCQCGGEFTAEDTDQELVEYRAAA